MIHEQIVTARNLANLSQKALATKCGLTQKTISLIENGSNVQLSNLKKIAGVLGLEFRIGNPYVDNVGIDLFFKKCNVASIEFKNADSEIVMAVGNKMICYARKYKLVLTSLGKDLSVLRFNQRYSVNNIANNGAFKTTIEIVTEKGYIYRINSFDKIL